MRLIKSLFGDNAEEKELIERKFDEMQSKLSLEMATLRNDNQSLHNQIEAKDRKIKELTEACRKQNEADLFLEIERLRDKILHGEKLPDINLSAYNSARSLDNLYRAQFQNQTFAGLLGGIGNMGPRFY